MILEHFPWVVHVFIALNNISMVRNLPPVHRIVCRHPKRIHINISTVRTSVSIFVGVDIANVIDYSLLGSVPGTDSGSVRQLLSDIDHTQNVCIFKIHNNHCKTTKIES